GLVEGREGDDAAELGSVTAERRPPERPADVLALADDDVAAEQDRRDQLPPLRPLALDLAPEELAQHPRSLRVADQDDAATVVVAAQVRPPRREHVAVGDLD